MRLRSAMVFFILIVLLLLVAACQPQVLPVATATPPQKDLTITALIQTITAQAPSLPTATLTPLQSVTETPSLPPTLTDTPAPVIPRVSVSSETNCRTGPTRHYKFISNAEVGRKFDLVGRYSPSDYWIIRLEDGRECWLWGQYATVEGEVNGLPEYIPPSVGKIEGEVRFSASPDATKIAQAFVDIGLGFDVYETGSDGRFLFEDVPAGEVKITVTHNSFDFDDPRVFVSAGQVTVVVISRRPPIIIITVPPLASPTATPTRRCPLLQPNCQFLPTFAPPIP